MLGKRTQENEHQQLGRIAAGCIQRLCFTLPLLTSNTIRSTLELHELSDHLQTVRDTMSCKDVVAVGRGCAMHGI